jgi:hypothetical protein
MRFISWSLLLFSLIVAASCSTVRVSQDYDVSAEFQAYKTYAWALDKQPETGDIRVDNQLLDARIRDAVDKNMAAKGYQKVDRSTADLLIVYHLNIRSRIEADTVSTGVGYGAYPHWGGVGYETRVREYDEGALVIDIGSAEPSKLLWRGTGTRRVTDHKDPEKTTQVVNKTVVEILAQFPPQQEK